MIKDLTLQSLHSIQLGEELVDHTVSDTCAVMASPGGQRVKLIKEEDAWFGSLGPVEDRRRSEQTRNLLSCVNTG